MPTYEYRCAKGHEFERFQRMSDEPLDACPECGAEAQRLLSAGAGFLFKGSGFYITDYRSEGYRESAKKDGADGVSTGSPADSPAGAKASVSGSESGGSGSNDKGASAPSSGKGTGSGTSGTSSGGGSPAGSSPSGGSSTSASD